MTEQDEIYEDIKEDGCAVTLQRNVQGVYNATTRKVTNTTTSYPTYGIITEYKTYEIDGTLIKRGDKNILLAIAVNMPEPIQDDNLLFGSSVWAVKNVEGVMPSGTNIAYKLQVRK